MSPTWSTRTCLRGFWYYAEGHLWTPADVLTPPALLWWKPPFKVTIALASSLLPEDIQVDPEEVRTDQSLVVGARSPQLCTPEVTRAS